MMEGGVNDARGHPVGNLGVQGCFARAALNLDPIAVLDAAVDLHFNMGL